ncbi:MAG: hypothetical protein ABI051_02695, partial [Vicinamibacterales bacterium]
MRLVYGSAIALALATLATSGITAQAGQAMPAGQAAPARPAGQAAPATPPMPAAQAAGQGETARSVAGGGITVPGWTGKVDPNEEKAGQTVSNAKLAAEGTNLHITTGPAITYWNPANKAAGDYTVKATF